MYGDHLWDDGKHKYNVTFFLAELDEISSPRYFSTFSQEALDDLVAKLRARGNSNATINRKISALRKLLRKSLRMGSIHSLPEFKREKERAGRIRFLEDDEEDRLFSGVGLRSPDYLHLAIFLVDTGARLGEALGLRWNDIHNGRATFWLTKSGRSRSVPMTKRAVDAVKAQAGATSAGLSPASRPTSSAPRGTRPRRKSALAATPTSCRTSCAIPARRASCGAASTSAACRCGSATRRCR